MSPPAQQRAERTTPASGCAAERGADDAARRPYPRIRCVGPGFEV